MNRPERGLQVMDSLREGRMQQITRYNLAPLAIGTGANSRCHGHSGFSPGAKRRQIC